MKASHGHSHDDQHHHGHSHRTGAATLYWRDPRAVSVTVVLFILFFLFYPRPTPNDQDLLVRSSDAGLVAWVDFERFGDIASTATVRVQPLPVTNEWCSPNVDLVACGSVSCISAFAKRLDVTLVVDAYALAAFAEGLDAQAATELRRRATVVKRSRDADLKVSRVLDRRFEALKATSLSCNCDEVALDRYPELRQLPQQSQGGPVLWARDPASSGRGLQRLRDAGHAVLMLGPGLQQDMGWLGAALRSGEAVDSLAGLEIQAQAFVERHRGRILENNKAVDAAWVSLLQELQRSSAIFDKTQCRAPSAMAEFAHVTASKRCLDVGPADRSCDGECPLAGTFFRADLGGCVSTSQCAVPTAVACMDTTFSSACSLECASAAFGRLILLERLVRSTMALANVTLFLLGGLLALIFAKVNWLNPLLEKYDNLLQQQGRV